VSLGSSVRYVINLVIQLLLGKLHLHHGAGADSYDCLASLLLLRNRGLCLLGPDSRSRKTRKEMIEPNPDGMYTGTNKVQQSPSFVF
jgi:hypothetical protein